MSHHRMLGWGGKKKLILKFSIAYGNTLAIQPKLTFATTFQLMYLHSSVRSIAFKEVTFTLQIISGYVLPQNRQQIVIIRVVHQRIN